MTQRERALLEALKDYVGGGDVNGRDLEKASCHIGLCPMTECRRCSRELAARKAIADYESSPSTAQGGE